MQTVIMKFIARESSRTCFFRSIISSPKYRCTQQTQTIFNLCRFFARKALYFHLPICTDVVTFWIICVDWSALLNLIYSNSPSVVGCYYCSYLYDSPIKNIKIQFINQLNHFTQLLFYYAFDTGKILELATSIKKVISTRLSHFIYCKFLHLRIITPWNYSLSLTHPITQ